MDQEMQKITAHIPVGLLESAREVTGKGITDTIKAGLKQLTYSEAYDNIRELRGKVRFSIDLDELRNDGK